jgi:hypothetical protein
MPNSFPHLPRLYCCVFARIRTVAQWKSKTAKGSNIPLRREFVTGEDRQWLNSAIKITIGMGTPSSRSKIERMMSLL